MALVFPTSPTTGQLSVQGTKTYQWDGAKWIIYANAQVIVGPTGPAAPALFTVSETAPTSPLQGQTWFNTGNGLQYAYVGVAWVEIGVSEVGPVGLTGPAGAASTIAGPTGPAGPAGPAGTISINTSVTGLVEVASVVAASTAAGITYNIDVSSSSVVYYTSASTAASPFTVNVRGSNTVTLNSLLAVGNSLTAAFINTCGAVATSYPSIFQIDSTTTPVKWVNSLTPNGGNSLSVDVYTYTILKTAANTYTVFGSQTRYA